MSRKEPKALVWFNGRILPAARARISVFDRGLLYGDAVFETIRIYAGQPFRWPAHHQRLRKTLARLSIDVPGVDLRKALDEITSAAGAKDAAVRLTITRGEGEGLLPPQETTPNILLMPRPIPPDLEAKRAAGVETIRLPFGQGRSGYTTGYKTTDYAAAVMGRRLAAKAGAFEALYVENDGNLSEATTSNLFVVRRGKVLTPPGQAGCLPGITREVVLQLARRSGLRVEEKGLRAGDLESAREIFLTGSVIEVMPVVRVDGNRIGDGQPGPVTRGLQEAYQRTIQRSVAGRRKST